MTPAANIATRTLKVLLCLLLAAWMVLPLPGCSSAAGLSPVASIALEEFEVYSDPGPGKDGEKYWRFLGYSDRVPWCACFTSWCAEQAGLIDAGRAPKNEGVLGWISFYQDHPEAGTIEDGDSYVPASGDFIVWQRSMDPDARFDSHIGVVESYDAETKTVYVIEGNSGKSLKRNAYPAGEGITLYLHPAQGGTASGMAGCTAALSGRTTLLPKGLGAVHSYMGWQTITSKTSTQYKLREMAGQNFDEEGFAKIDNRYVIACTDTYGNVGDYVDWHQADGTVIQTVIGDIKNQTDEGCNMWGHLDGTCVVEFVVDKDSWYGSNHANPGTPSCHPEWNQEIVQAVNLGSWFDGGGMAGPAGTSAAMASCTRMAAESGSVEGGTLEQTVFSLLRAEGLGPAQAAAIMAVMDASNPLEGEGWENPVSIVEALMSQYSSWSASSRTEFETMTDPQAAAEYFGRSFAGLGEEGISWQDIRQRAESLLGSLQEG